MEISQLILPGFFLLLLAAIMGALIFSPRFRQDLLAGSGEAKVLGILSVNGGAIVVLFGLLVGATIWTAPESASDQSAPVVTIRQAEDNALIVVLTGTDDTEKVHNVGVAELEEHGFFHRDRISNLVGFSRNTDWIPVNKETGRTMGLDFPQLGIAMDRPPKDILKDVKLKLLAHGDRTYRVALLSDNDYVLGNVDYPTIQSVGLFRHIKEIRIAGEPSPVITAKFDSVWQDDDDIYPFQIEPISASSSIKIQPNGGAAIRRSANMGKLVPFTVDDTHYAVTIGKVHIRAPFPSDIGTAYLQFKLATLDVDYR